MSKIETGRLSADNQEGLVVFLVGARINKWWLLPLSLPILAKMRAMQRELLADPESGLLGMESLGSADVQYWRSLEHLLAYADDSKRQHKPTSQSFFRKLFKNQAVGIWHETYVVPAGHYESIYTNMPKRGLGRFRALAEPTGTLSHARGRLAATAAPQT